jgi:glyoxylase-like metal-dependent hydrolase (beta-lactamase superfamily II)
LAEEPPDDLVLGATTVCFGEARGKYPQGNSLFVRGREESLVIDPSLGLLPRRGALPAVDRVVNSHCHEDHVAGNHLFPRVPWHVHEADLPGLQSFAGFLAIFGYDDASVAAGWAQVVRERFHYTERPDALPFRDGDVFDLGGGVRVRVIHTPGHTRGHSALFVEPDGVLYLGDIDLSSFGPYYGDAWSELEDFEKSLVKVRGIEARHYATFHHVGVVDRLTFLERLDRYAAVIGDRERRLLAFLAEAPRSLDEVAEHRFVYRKSDPVAFAAPVERRSMSQHIARLVRQGRVREVAPGRFRADVVSFPTSWRRA